MTTGSILEQPSSSRHWNAERKMLALKAIRDGTVTVSDLQEKRGITPEEIAEWNRGFETMGREGLMIRTIGIRRKAYRFAK